MRIERQCPMCGRVITDRTATKCPNFKSHVQACEAARERKKLKTATPKAEPAP